MAPKTPRVPHASRAALRSRREARFVGRVEELATLQRALAGDPHLVLVEGEAGVGKTRLLAAMLADRESQTALVAYCPPFRQPQTLGPVIDAVRTVANQVSGLGLSPLGGALRPLLPEWSADLPAALEPAEDATAARHRVFRALLELLDRLGIRLLIVEDAHWADDATLEFLLFLTARGDHEVSLVVTYRPEDVPARSLLRRLGARRSALAGEVRIGLGPLSEQETAELVSSMLAGKPVTAEFARFLFERTDGLPLAVEESMRLMVDRDDVIERNGDVLRRRLAEIAVPATIRDAALERTRRLSDRAQRVLRAVAVLGTAAPADIVRYVSGLGPRQARDGLAEAMESGLLAEDARGRAGFQHVLPGQVVYEATPVSARRAMHLRAGEVLEAAPLTPAAELVRHFRNARDTARWTRYAEKAADLAIAVGDQTAADLLLFDAIVHAGQPALTRARLASKISFAIFPGEDAARDLIAALAAPLGGGTVPQAEEGAVRFQIARVRAACDDYTTARADFEVAARCLPAESVDATMAMIQLGWPNGDLCPAAENLHWLRRAAAVPAPREPAQRLRLLVERVTALLSLGEESGWTEAAQISDDADSVLTAFQVLRGAGNVADLAIMWGRYDEADRRLGSVLRGSEKYGYQRLHAIALGTRAQLDWYTGAWDGLAERARRLASWDDLPPNSRAEATTIVGLLHSAHGTVQQARDRLAHALAEATRHGLPRSAPDSAAALARLSLADGDVTEALRLTGERMDVIARKGVWVWAAEVAPVRVAALLTAGRADEAAGLADAMRRGLRGKHAPAPRAALLVCTALLAEARGDLSRAGGLFDRAARAWRALPRPYDALLAQERLARCALSGGHPENALASLAETAQELAALGAIADADRAIRLLRDNGVAARRSGAGRPRHLGILSPRELDVVRLLATGGTDKEIAESLFVSPKTVATHLDSARRKLGAPTRTALVVAALDAGLIDPPR